MVTAASWGAALLYLFPIALVLWARARRDRTRAAVALDIPLAVATDFALVLLLALFMRLELAIFASRALWLAGGAALAAARRARWPRWPRSIRRVDVVVVAALVGTSVLISMALSRPYSIWDRKWHTPLVASLRGQSLPFHNVFNAAEVLHYHFSGDVHAAMLQSLSFGVIHSSFALSLSHDLMFGLAAATLALVLRGAGVRSGLFAVGTLLGVLLSGPLTLGRQPDGRAVEGYNFLNYLTMSFRPHDAVAALFYVGFVGAVMARILRRGPLSPAETIPGLVACTVGLAISDETSIGLLGLALGVAWLAHPDVIHPRRAAGAAVLALLLVALVVPNLAFSGSLSPGAQSYRITLVPWRSPGNYTPTLPLSAPEGRRMLMFDLLPTAAVWAGGALVWLASRGRRGFALLLLATVLLAISVFALTRVDVNATALESHRFMTGALFLSPLLGAAQLFGWPWPGAARAPSAAPRALRALGAAMLAAGAGLGAASTLTWITDLAPSKAHRHNHFFTNEDLFAIDCRDLGAQLGGVARSTYLSKSIWYAAAGCHPVFAPARRGNNQWDVTIGNPEFEGAALRALDQRVRPAERLPVVCPRTEAAKDRDPVCAYAQSYARSHAECHDLGPRLVRCELSREARREMLQ